MTQVYGIPNCDTVKKALAWLKENDIEFEFHNFKKEGITSAKIKEWLKTTSLEKMLNKKSTAFKNLSEEDKKSTSIKDAAIKLMEGNTNLIKRPVMEINGTILNGFIADEFKKAFLIN